MGELLNYGSPFELFVNFRIRGELLMDSPPITQGLGRRPKIEYLKAKNAVYKTSSDLRTFGLQNFDILGMKTCGKDVITNKIKI